MTEKEILLKLQKLEIAKNLHIKYQNYERAATLRDQIRIYQEKLGEILGS